MKSEKRACVVVNIVLVNAKLAKNSTMDHAHLFWYYNQKNIASIAVLNRHIYAGKKRLRWHRYINTFFGLKIVVNQKSVNIGMISARHTANKQNFI